MSAQIAQDRTMLHVNIPKAVRQAIKMMAEDSGLRMTEYVRLILDQHTRTPMKISIRQHKGVDIVPHKAVS